MSVYVLRCRQQRRKSWQHIRFLKMQFSHTGCTIISYLAAFSPNGAVVMSEPVEGELEGKRFVSVVTKRCPHPEGIAL